MVKIRLSRKGRKNRPFYWIISADSRCPRDGKYIEKLGTYDPLEKKTNLSLERIKYWTEVGAQQTERVKKIISTYVS